MDKKMRHNILGMVLSGEQIAPDGALPCEEKFVYLGLFKD